MKAIVIQPDASVQVRDVPEPEIVSPEGAVARTLGCGLCGTDLLKMNLGMVKKPTVLGHEWVGVIEKTGPLTKGFVPGDLVVAAHHVPCGHCSYCRHGNESMCADFKATNFFPGGFAEKIYLSGRHLQHVTFKIPSTLAWEEAILTEPLACCERGLHGLNLQAGDTVVIVGLGSIGLMIATLLRRQDIRVVGLDTDTARCEQANGFGIAAGFAGPDESFLQHLQKTTSNRRADGVIFTAGPASLLNQSLNWIRDGGFINLFSHLAGERAEIDTAALYHREIRIVSAYSSSPDSLRRSFALLKDGNLNLRRLFAPAYAPEQFGQAVADVNTRRILKALIRFA